MNESFNKNNMQNNNNNNHRIKPILENIQLNGFYDIFYREILKYEKDYLLFIKSSFTPLGYNIKISTESGFIEAMSYDTYLCEFGSMKNSASVKFTVPSVEAGAAFLVGKFSVKFNNVYFNNTTNSNSHFSTMADLYEHFKKDLIKIKFIVNSQEVNLIQFLNFYIFKSKNINENNNSINDSNSSNKRNLQEKFFNDNQIVPINEIININPNEYELNDEIIVNLIFYFLIFFTFFILNF